MSNRYLYKFQNNTFNKQMWKRRSNELAYSWGTIKMTGLDEPRASFRGEMRIDHVTDLLQPQYPRWKTYVKVM